MRPTFSFAFLALVSGLASLPSPARADEILSWIGVGATGDTNSDSQNGNLGMVHAEFGQRSVQQNGRILGRVESSIGADAGSDDRIGGDIEVGADGFGVIGRSGDCGLGAGVGFGGRAGLHWKATTTTDGYEGWARVEGGAVCSLGRQTRLIVLPWVGKAIGKNRSRSVDEARVGVDLEVRKGKKLDLALTASTTAHADDSRDGREHRVGWEGHLKVAGPWYLGARGDLRRVVDRDRKPTLFGPDTTAPGHATGLEASVVTGLAW